MTEVVFYFNAPDRLAYASRLLRKAYFKDARLQVLADADLANELDHHLWVMAGTEFIPHATEASSPAVKEHSAIFIAHQPCEARAEGEILVNLSDQFAQSYTGFARVIEVVTTESSVRALARERWKRYKLDGIEPIHLDVQKHSPAP